MIVHESMTEKLKLPTLLLISDNPSIEHWMKKNLEGQFYIIEESTQSSALEAAKSTALDLIILDSQLENCDPLELSHLLRQINTSISILLITGRLKKSYREEALASGVSDFLNDQLEINELRERIETGRKTAAMQKKTADISLQIKKKNR